MPRPDLDDPDLTLAELFAEWPDAISVFLARQMLCPGCLVAPFHTVIDACEEYDLDEESFRTEIRNWIRRTEEEAGTLRRA